MVGRAALISGQAMFNSASSIWSSWSVTRNENCFGRKGAKLYLQNFYLFIFFSRSEFSEKLPEASPVSKEANLRQLQEKSTAAQGQAKQLW